MVKTSQHDNTRHRWVARSIGLGMAALIGLGAAAVHAADEIMISEQQAASVGIEAEPLADQPTTRGVVFPARVTIPPQQIIVVSAAIAARVDSIEVQEDQAVSGGAVLARLNSPSLIRAQSEFLQAVNQEKFLQETLAREQSLASDRTVSLKQMQATRNEHAQATASVAERRQILRDYGMSDEAIGSLVSSRVFDSKTVVTSPINGVVLDILIAPGQRIEAQAPLIKVARLTPLWLEIQVPAQRAARFALGIPVEVSGYGVAARVIAVGTSADKATQAVTVRAEVSDGAAGLKPGQFVEVLVKFQNEGGKTWSIRPEAIVRRGKDAFVFVKTITGFRVQAVTVVEETREAALITGPLRGDESVAVRGLVALKGAWQGLGGSQ
ncbi:MAG: efflux RND transporter periplasmic adaptor subunit [Reyranella sp.]|nr:efflux RND transporter periplasmic adaptor subunit [Reyranella sp.]